MNKPISIFRPRFVHVVYFLRRYFLRNAVSQLGGIYAVLQVGSVYATPPLAHELPTGVQVVAGSANISQNLNTLNVQQNSNRLISNWQTFNIGSEATVNFLQPNASSVALNRVLSEGASQIFGRLNANGQVFLINPSGVLFSSGSRVDVGGLVASSLGISNEDFLTGNAVFENAGNGSVINNGSLSAIEGGYIALMAPRVINNGVIKTDSGTTALAAGNKVSLDFSGKQLLNMTVDQGLVDALIENKAMISAANGTVYMSAKAADAISRSVVNTTGVVEATGIAEKGGRIFLTAEGGDLTLANTVNISSTNAQGGDVVVSGDVITIASNTSINASGATGGGDVLIGGDWQGSGDLSQATQVTMQDGASIDASAIESGDGGKIVLWSDITKTDSVTTVAGNLTARGGANGGDGGAIETSGHQVDTANIRVDAGANVGSGGLWLIDPYNYTVDATAAGNISSTLNTGTSVTVTTTVDDAATGSLGGAGSDVGNLTVTSAITKSAGGDATLTLKADRHIFMKESITSSSNRLNVVLWSDQDGDNFGAVDFQDSANPSLEIDVTTNGGHLWIGGGSGTTTWNGLTVGDDEAHAGTNNPSSGIQFFEKTTITTGGGDIYMAADTHNASGVDFRLGVRASTSIDAGGGDIELLGDKITFANNSTFETSGELTIASYGASFADPFGWNGTLTGGNLVGSDSLAGVTINNVGSLGGLTLGKDGNSAAITLTSALDINGSVNIFGGNVNTISDWDITGSVNIDGDEIITSGVWNVGGDVSIVGNAELISVGDTINTMGDDVLLKNTGTIDLLTDATITTLGGDITLWSNSDNSGNGSIILEDNVTLDTRTATDRTNNTHTSGGGDITLAGGLDTDSDGRPDGFAVSDTDPGIAMGTSGANTTTLYSGGGDLLIRGMGLADAIPSNHNTGVDVSGFLQADSGTGSISIFGESADSTGVFFSRSKTSGEVLDLKSSATSGTAISIVGTATGTAGGGVSFTHAPSIKTLQATGGGDIVITGSGTGTSEGIVLLNTRVLASSGDILIDGGVNGSDIYNATLGALAGTDVLSSSSNLTITGDSFTTFGTSTFDTTGTVTFDSFSDSFSGLYDVNVGIAFADIISGLTIGKSSNTADVTLSTDVDIAGPVTVYGGDITIENLINTEGGGAASDILLKATGNVVVNETLTFETSGGDITLWSNSDNSGNGSILLEDNVTLDSRTATDRTNNTHTSGGGDITLAGGLDTDSDGRPDGFAVSDTNPAIALGTSGANTTTLYSGGGDLLIRGMGLADAIQTNHNIGVEAFGFLQADSGTGSISIIGESADSTGVFFSRGKTSGEALDLKSSATSGTAISIVGTATGSAGGGVNFAHDSSIKTLQATGGGDIVITGSGAGTSGGIVLFSSRVLASSGDILIDGGVNGSDIYNSTLGALAGTDVLSSSSNLTVTGDSFTTFGTSTFDTTGTVTFDSFSDSFSGLYDDVNVGIALADTISGLTIGKASNTADVTLKTDVNIAGPVTVYGGDITIENLINTEGGGAAGDILLKASGNVVVNASLAFDTNGGDITLWSDSDANDAGNVLLNNNVTLDTRTATDRANNTHTNGGGDITLAGGLDSDSDGRPDGFAVSDTDPGVTLGTSGANTTTLYSGGGDLLIRGMGLADAIPTNHNFGIDAFGFLQADSGTGSISIIGESADSTAVFFSRGKTSGDVLDLKSSATSGTAISIVGTATGSDAVGVNFTHDTSIKTLQATGGGDIVITGSGTGTSEGIKLLNTRVLASSGDILLDSGVNGMDFTLSTIGALAGTDVLSSSSNITVTGDSLVARGGSSLDTTGTVTFDSFSDSFSGLYDVNVGIAFADTISGLTIGKSSNTADVTLSTDVDIAGPVTVYGGDITIENLINTEGGGAASDILLKASGNVVVNASLAFDTNGGDITLWSDSDANDAGNVLLNDNVTLDSRTATDRTNNTHTNGGGDITLAGGLDTDSDGRPDGFAVSDTDPGVTLGTSGANTTTLYSGGGDLLIRGKGLVDAIQTNHNFGIEAFGFLQADSGTGSISIIGESADSTGVIVSRSKTTGEVLDLKSSATSGTAISIVGTAIGSDGVGVSFTHKTSSKSLQATGGGDIEIIGTGAGSQYGIKLLTSRVLASSGDILIDSGVNGIDIYNATLGALAGTDVLSSSSNLTVTGDSFTTFGSSMIDTTGTVTFDSFSDSFDGLYDDINAGIAFADTISGLTIGKASNTADVTLSADVDIAGPVTVYGGDLNFDNLVTSTAVGGTITLNSSGTINQGSSAAFAAANLNITTDDGNSGTSAADVILQNDANEIATLTADVDGSLSYRDSNALSISRDTTNGITAQGTILVETLTGDLTINDNIVTTDDSVSAVILNAGKNTAAGTSTGGNIIANSSPTITVGSGGRATLYSGDVDNSTGLTSLVQSGSGRFRYNSDEADSNFTSALSAGIYAIYREQPTLVVTATSEMVTYGTAAAGTVSLSATQNGDTSGQIFSAAPTVTVGGATSTSGNYTVGSHSLTPTAAVDQLGYALSFTNGSLTVNQKSITTTLSGSNKEYDGTTTSSIGISGNGLVAGDVTSINGSGLFENKNAGTGKSINVTGLNITGTDGGNYVLDSTTGTTFADITQKDLSVSGIVAIDKIYDGATTAEIDFSSALYTGLIVGDDFSLSSVTGVFSDENAGTAKTVSLSSSYSGSDLPNYTVVDQLNTVANIAPKALTIDLAGQGIKTYDGTTVIDIMGITPTLVGFLAGDDVSADSGNVVGYVDKNVGSNKYVEYTGFGVSGTDSGNYVLPASTVESTAAVLAKELTVSGITASDKIYDANTAAVVDFASAVFTGLVSGDDFGLSDVSGVFDNKNVGTAKTVSLSSSYAGTDVGNYAITDQATSSADVTQKVLTVSGITAESKVYDGSDAAVSHGSAVILDGLIGGDDFGLESTSGTFSDKNVGTGKEVTLSNAYAGADLANYNIGDQLTASADITQKAITVGGITADNKVYDGSTNATVRGSDVVFTGLVAGDVLNWVTSVGVFSDPNVGTNKVVALNNSYSGADLANYSLTDQASTTADITQKELRVSGITAADKVYDGNASALVDASIVAISGVVEGDSVSLESSTGVFSDKNAGAGKTVTLSNTYTGGDLANYSVSDQSTTTADIGQKPLTVSGISANDKVYDGRVAATLAVTDAAYEGLIVGDDLALDLVTGEFSDANAGELKTVSISSTFQGVDVVNYDITTQEFTTASIDSKPLAVLANNDRRFADGFPYHGGNGVIYNGFVAGESSDNLAGVLVFTGSSQGAVDVGNYDILPSGLSSTNYELIFNGGQLEIVPVLETAAESGSLQQLNAQEFNPLLFSKNRNIDEQGPVLDTSNVLSLSCSTTEPCTTVNGICVQSKEAVCK